MTLGPGPARWTCAPAFSPRTMRALGCLSPLEPPPHFLWRALVCCLVCGIPLLPDTVPCPPSPLCLLPLGSSCQGLGTRPSLFLLSWVPTSMAAWQGHDGPPPFSSHCLSSRRPMASLQKPLLTLPKESTPGAWSTQERGDSMSL